MRPCDSSYDRTAASATEALMEALRRVHTVHSTTAGNVLVDEGTDHERDIAPADWDQMAMGWDGTADGLESMGWEAAAEAMRDAEDEEPEPIRQQVSAAMRKHVRDALVKMHERNYCTLYVDHDGRIWWGEEVAQSTRVIDNQAEHFAPVASLLQVGTGSCKCNCDPCRRGEDPQNYGFEGDEYSVIETRMERSLEEISVGYFEDEDDEDGEKLHE